MAEVMGNTGSVAGHVGQMLSTHPMAGKGADAKLLRCIEACLDCSSTCVSCADACLSEKEVQKLVACIRLNQDCANICDVTAKVLTRQSMPDADVVRSIVQACLTACRKCAAECSKHASMMEHCRVCAEACNACAKACEGVLAAA